MDYSRPFDLTQGQRGMVIGGETGDVVMRNWNGVLACVAGAYLGSVTSAFSAEPPGLSAQALQLHRESLVIDGHNNLLMKLRKKADLTVDTVDLQNGFAGSHTDIPRLRDGGVGAEFFAIYISNSSVKKGTAVKETLEQIEQLQRLVRRFSQTLEVAGSATDIQRIHDAGKVAAVITVEGGNAIDDSLPVLRTYQQAGVRCMALTHDDTTDWADAALDKAKHGGLSKFGEQVVAEMNRLGIAIDLSHSSAETIKDTLSVSRAPVLFTHSAAHKLAPHPRNLSDDVLKDVAKNGGVVMVNFFPAFLTAENVKAYEARTQAAVALKKSFKTEEQYEVALQAWLKEHPLPATTVKHVVDQIDHIGKTVGFDHVGLGSNFDGVISVSKNLEDVSHFPHLTQEMLDRDYSREQIQKVLGGNALRVLRRVEEVAREVTNSQLQPAVATSGR